MGVSRLLETDRTRAAEAGRVLSGGEVVNGEVMRKRDHNGGGKGGGRGAFMFFSWDVLLRRGVSSYDTKGETKLMKLAKTF